MKQINTDGKVVFVNFVQCTIYPYIYYTAQQFGDFSPDKSGKNNTKSLDDLKYMYFIC